jgi:hypothetical protein
MPDAIVVTDLEGTFAFGLSSGVRLQQENVGFKFK